jgi:hypothetical protein
MSSFIGNVNGPHHNSPRAAADVWCNMASVELRLFSDSGASDGLMRSFDPIAARNLAALLVRASDEVERMADRRRHELDKPYETGEST